MKRIILSLCAVFLFAGSVYANPAKVTIIDEGLQDFGASAAKDQSIAMQIQNNCKNQDSERVDHSNYVLWALEDAGMEVLNLKLDGKTVNALRASVDSRFRIDIRWVPLNGREVSYDYMMDYVLTFDITDTKTQETKSFSEWITHKESQDDAAQGQTKTAEKILMFEDGVSRNILNWIKEKTDA